MDLKLFFDPTEVDEDKSAESFQSSLYINHSKMPDHQELDMALIGIQEFRGADKKSEAYSAEEVRKQLYRLKKGFGDYGIIDLGNLRNGPTLEDTYLRLKEVVSYLMGNKIIPIIFGGTHDVSLGQYFGYEDAEKLISVLSVDSNIDLNGEAPINCHMARLLKHAPNYLFNYYHLAYQSFLTDSASLSLLEDLSFETFRLGVVKENIREVEPIIRDADMLTFDLSAIQQEYAPGALGAKVYGLTGEEACQIMWYAGQNEKLSSIGIFNYKASLDQGMKTAFVISTMIWYFTEGFYHRKGGKNFMSNDYLKYEVHLGGDPETIRFFKSRLSERWWMEVPNYESHGFFNRNRIIACNYSDYEMALKGELPTRWINFFNKTNP